MNIGGLPCIETDEEIVFKLIEPFWGAWSIYKWEVKESGIGINVEVIQYAHQVEKPIVAVYEKDRYQISPVTINNWYKKQVVKPIWARKGVKLIVIPKSMFTHTEGKFNREEYEKKEIERDKSIQKSLF